MMKKMLFCAALALAFAVSAADGFKLGFWFDAPEGIGSTNVRGLRIGLPVSAGRSTDGAELSLLGNFNKKMEGFQWAWIGINMTDRLQGAQLACINLVSEAADGVALQLGFYNQLGRGGFQLGVINNGCDKARFQLGLININHDGWLPIMIIFNFAN